MGPLENPSTPSGVLKLEVLEDELATAKRVLLENPSTPSGVLKQLAVPIRAAIVRLENPSTPSGVLKPCYLT